jgi:hypothetical protein
MHLRISTVRRKNKTYKYAQLVESYRRQGDGVTMKRVVANLGRRTETEVANLRAALEASRSGEALAVARVDFPPPPKPVANLRYLDVALLLELWRAWGLDEAFRELIPRGQEEIAPADVVAALAIHRCVDPGSKLKATRWFPRTALPELLNIPPSSFHNSRLHRVLDKLDEATPALMRRLPSIYREHEAASSALFIDATDACFTGHGPELAARGRAKDGAIRRMIIIVLLCNQDGFPLRWRVIAGNEAEGPAMVRELCDIARLSWGAKLPVVVDRALGRTAYLRELLDNDVKFLTALVRPEFPAYVAADDIPYQVINKVPLHSHAATATNKAALGEAIQAAGFVKAAGDLYVCDLGVVERDEVSDAELSDSQLPDDLSTRAMTMARAIRQAVESGSAASQAAAGRQLQLTKAMTKKYCRLHKLTDELQSEILQGAAVGVPLGALIRVAAVPAQAQRDAFDELLRKRAEGGFRRHKTPQPSAPTKKPQPVRVRAVAYFNPILFLDQRATAQRRIQRVHDYVNELNSSLRSPRSRRDRNSTAAAVDRKLRRWNLVEAFEVEITTIDVNDRDRYQVSVTLRENEWACRRRFDGFSLLVTHPGMEMDAIEVCKLYRSKDTVEKNFQVIKSTVALQPIWHQNDTKVRAHVTLCMLSLLLERSLRKELGDLMSTNEALDRLQDCRLNRFQAPASQAAYLLTQTDAEQDEILRRLGLQHLADDVQMIDALHPR